jgi:hypothetical protein
MLHSRYEVRDRDGGLLGIYPAPISDHAEEVRALIEAHPGAKVTSTVTTDRACAAHPAYEADNCPICRTSRL